ncbi:hypothetical protein VNO78_35261 [Psophocarpus tetragonolobus]|uniref:Uncharacterized protein n=1 Tax=Psophocarpus tetragonolobus TaxID=3891 RepID=A0AAN9RHG2_PSOTE
MGVHKKAKARKWIEGHWFKSAWIQGNFYKPYLVPVTRECQLILQRLHQLNRKLNSKDESRLEGDQKTDSRSPKIRKLVCNVCLWKEKSRKAIHMIIIKKGLPIRLLKQECCWLRIPSAKAFSLPINDDLSSANYSNKALANLVE